MALIVLETFVNAPRERVFDLARCVDVHLAGAEATGERVVAGVSRGLLEAGDEVTWEARHLGVLQRLRVVVTRMERPLVFQDVMVEGAFARMVHDHEFEEGDGGTVMVDRFDFCVPLGVPGRVAEALFLTGYMRRFLEGKNGVLKGIAESEGEWRRFVEE